jgi:hypothetical protein
MEALARPRTGLISADLDRQGRHIGIGLAELAQPLVALGPAQTGSPMILALTAAQPEEVLEIGAIGPQVRINALSQPRQIRRRRGRTEVSNPAKASDGLNHREVIPAVRTAFRPLPSSPAASWTAPDVPGPLEVVRLHARPNRPEVVTVPPARGFSVGRDALDQLTEKTPIKPELIRPRVDR